ARAGDADLHTSFLDPIVDLAARADEQADRDVGKSRFELADERREHVLSGNRAPPHRELTAHAPLELLDRLLGFARQRENPSSVAEQQLSSRRRGRATAHAVEQWQTELLLQRAHVLGDSGLRQEQRLGGAGETSELSDLGENFEATKIHRTSAVGSGLLVAGAAATAAAAARHGGRHETRAGLEGDDGERALDVAALTARTGHCGGARGNEALKVFTAGFAAVLVNRHRAYWPPRCT